jgi:hypothetical protein
MLKFISLIVFINVLWHVQHGKAPIEGIDEDKIFCPTYPMTTIIKALNKAKIEYLCLLRKRPLTEEDRERIVELQNTITNFGVSGIFTYFYQL